MKHLLKLLRRMAYHRAGVVGGAMVVIFLLAGILAPWLAPYDPLEGDLSAVRQRPSPEHWLGTDELGRDVLSRLLHGAAITLRMGGIAVVVGVALGVPFGAMSGYFGGLTDLFVQRVIDVLLAFPGVLLAILVVSITGTGLEKVMIALGIVSIPIYTRLARACVLSLREETFVEAAGALGISRFRILVRHIAPNAMSPIIIQSAVQFAAAILAGSALGFLGLGAQAPTPEWGASMAAGRLYLRTAPHLVLFPGLALSLVVLGFNLFGDALRDTLDPRQVRGS